MNVWVSDVSKHSSKSRTSSTRNRLTALLVAALLCANCHLCQAQAPTDTAPTATAPAVQAPAVQTLSNRADSDRANPVVLLDSYHAHNFLDRGLIPGEHKYHHLTALRRATHLLRERGLEVGELIIGPITPQRLRGVKLIILNLPSADRPPWLVSEIEAVVEYVRRGGGIIFITDHSNCYYHQYHLLPLWERLGLIPTFETVCERQPDCRLTSSGDAWVLIRQFEPHPVTQSIRYLAIQTGGRVVGPSVVARTSGQAWADAGATPMYAEGPISLFGDFKYSASEEAGPQGVVLAQAVGQGRVVVISDQNALGDMQISYADNWRLWLNACQWAGGLKFDPQGNAGSGSKETLTPVPLNERSLFEQILAQEPDRNGQPHLPEGSWQIECWEPLSRGVFHWGGTDAAQLYHLWCWLNRWTWTSAHEQPSNPNPVGRAMLWLVDSDLTDGRLRERQQTVLAGGGKVILLPAVDQPAAPDNQKPNQQSSDAQAAWRDRCLAQLGISSANDLTWQTTPMGHWQHSTGRGTLVMIPDATCFRNSSFERPERVPSATHAKWLADVYRWLFEQP